MKLYAKIKARRGGREAVKGDDVRLLVELSYKNKVLGTVGLYPITSSTSEDLGYRIVWENGKGFPHQIIEEVEKGETQKGECFHHYNYKGNTDELSDKCTYCGEMR